MAFAVVILRALAFLVPLLAAGWTLARIGRREADAFAAVFWGLGLTSVASILLGRSGHFSLALLAATLGATACVAGIVGRIVPEKPTVPAAPVRHRRLAALAALLSVAWSWPPFETFMAASDSTMYVDAGVHLATTGSYTVADTVARELSPDLARALFMSVGIFDSGPYVRLPGGLLMQARDAHMATPAFFPLISAWSGILTAIGGPALAPTIAPVAMALATWALASFALEALGLAAAVATVLVFLGNFAVWWFGRFTMSEPLTIAFVWAGLVFLVRERAFSAGVMLGIAGVARAETIVFTIGAVAWWAVTAPVPRRTLLALVSGAALAGALALAGLVASPNHQLSYLRTDLSFATTQILLRYGGTLSDGRALSVLALSPLVPAWAAVVAARRGKPVVRSVLRLLLTVGTVALAGTYAHFAGGADPVRHLGWLATSMSGLGLALALAGGAVVWTRGGTTGRLAVILVALVSVVFVLNPRVGDYQPWAMRRFLPIVLPGLALFAGAAIATVWRAERRGLATVAALLCVATVALQIRPVLTIRRAAYFAGSLSAIRKVADAVPSETVLVIDGGFAELQMQVPIWLVFGRETVLATGGGPAWRALLGQLLERGRSVYWLQHRFAPPPQAPELVFHAVDGPSDVTVDLPHSPADVPPSAVIRKVVPLQLYDVTRRS